MVRRDKNSASWNYGVLNLVLLEVGTRMGLNMFIKGNGCERKWEGAKSDCRRQQTTSLTPTEGEREGN